MGVINLKLQNTALLLRWLWRIHSLDRRLWGKYAVMIHALRWDPDGPLFLSASGSFFWKALIGLKTLFHSCVSYHIGSGRKTSFWFDPWSGQALEMENGRTLPHRRASLYQAKQIATRLFQPPLTYQQHIAMESLTHLSFQQGPDRIFWRLTGSGVFSVKSVYKVLSQGGKVMTTDMNIWKTPVSPSMRIFFYLLLNDRILTHEIMQRRNLGFTPGCVMCDRTHSETGLHLFFSCTYARTIWTNLQIPVRLSDGDSVRHIYTASIPREREHRRQWTAMFITALWCIWLERNHRTFRDSRTPPGVLLNKIQQQARLCNMYC